MTGEVHRAVLDLLRARSGRVEEFEAELDRALDRQPPDCLHSRLLVDGVRQASRAISAAHQGRAVVRVLTPEGAAVTFEFEHSEARARAVTRAVVDALDDAATGDPLWRWSTKGEG